MYVNMCMYIFALDYDYVITKTILRLYTYIESRNHQWDSKIQYLPKHNYNVSDSKIKVMTHLAFFSLVNPLLYGQHLFGYVVDMIQFEGQFSSYVLQHKMYCFSLTRLVFFFRTRTCTCQLLFISRVASPAFSQQG